MRTRSPFRSATARGGDSFWKKDLAQVERQPGKSPMPSCQGQLADAELTDLVAYLASLRKELK